MIKSRIQKEEYWNKGYMDNIKKLYGSDVFSTRKCIEQYIKTYPEDYSGWFFYIEVLITLQEYELAEEILKKVCKKYKKDPNNNKQKKLKYYEQLEEETKIRFYLATHQYDDALDYIEYNKSLKSYLQLELKIYCMNKLGIKTNTSSETYNCKQMINYSEERAIKEMKNRIDAANKNPYEYYLEKRFSDGFPLEKAIEEVKKNLCDENKLCFGFYNDTYIFKYNLCGRIGVKIQDFFKVSCFHDTHDIIIMYPASNCEKLPYVDLNYLNNVEKPIQKKLSQIDKFNKRYNKREN